MTILKYNAITPNNKWQSNSKIREWIVEFHNKMLEAGFIFSAADSTDINALSTNLPYLSWNGSNANQRYATLMYFPTDTLQSQLRVKLSFEFYRTDGAYNDTPNQTSCITVANVVYIVDQNNNVLNTMYSYGHNTRYTSETSSTVTDMMPSYIINEPGYFGVILNPTYRNNGRFPNGYLSMVLVHRSTDGNGSYTGEYLNVHTIGGHGAGITADNVGSAMQTTIMDGSTVTNTTSSYFFVRPSRLTYNGNILITPVLEISPSAITSTNKKMIMMINGIYGICREILIHNEARNVDEKYLTLGKTCDGNDRPNNGVTFAIYLGDNN